ncbi:DUF1653 domain-containing protein [Dyella sp.]|uniref:DUF1653 domain-containing protein n=1 Tax=Dyella sp. TaxID=1869338 RepID=UPI002ED4B168
MSVIPGIYRHYKGPRYRVLGTARHSETEDSLVVYQALYGEFGLWVRPAAMFAETVTIGGEQIPRFALERAMASPLDELSHDLKDLP